jgi:hypothetical protein
MIKIYASDNKKYKREEYNILDIKLQVFFNYYIKVGLINSQFYLVFFIIFKR